MDITVLIATRNRPAGLRQTLQSLLCSTNLQAGNWEALVISQDYERPGESLQVCEEFQTKFPNHFRFLVQAKTGKCNALNLGITAARGEILALTDDDVLVAPNYIESIRTVFKQYSPDAVQGRVLLDCEGGLPNWMSRRQAAAMGECDHGDEVLDWNHHTLFGTNMAVRLEAARRIGGFSAELGPGTAVGFADDSEFSFRLRQAGYNFIYAPQIVARHQVPRSRLTRSYFRKRSFRLGRSKAYYDYDPLPDVPFWRYGLYSAKYALLKEAQALWHYCANRAAEALDGQCYAREKLGFFWQHCRFRFGEPRRLSRADFRESSEQATMNCDASRV